MSFRLKIFFSLLAGQMLVLVVTGFFGASVMQKLARKYVEQRGVENAALLASTLAEPLRLADLEKIDAALSALTLDPYLNQAAAYDSDGRIVSFAGADAIALSQLAPEVMSALPLTVFDLQNRQHFVAIRAEGREIGVLWVSVGMTDLGAVVAALGLTTALPLLLAPAGTMLLSWLLAMTLTRRISDLQIATDKFAQEGLSVRVPTHGSDEIALLAQSFNRMAEHLEDDQRNLEKRMRTDYLTGIPNRFATEEFLQDLLTRSPRPEFNILHIDLDKFKLANDLFGHACGDAVLREVARRLSLFVNADQDEARTDVAGFVGRIGGDEFIAVYPDQGEDRIVELANDLLMRLNEPVRYESEPVHVGASIGIARAGPDDSQVEVSTLLEMADIAMYEAKRKSGNGAVLLDAVLRERTRAERVLISEVSQGLDAGEFVPFLQPQIDLRSGSVAGFEVLARWQHPQKGLRMPAEFLLGLRDKDLRNTIDQSVRRAAMSWFAQIRKSSPELGRARIAINIGQQQIADRRISAKLQALLHHTGLPANAVAIEILENTLIDEKNVQLRDNLRQLQEMGFAIELDDFGTGNSSMSSLLGISVGRIKIDRSFVAGVDSDTKRKHIISAIVGIGHAFGAEVLAEGVETPGQLSALRILGCDYVQGFLLCPPMCLEDTEKWLAARAQGAGAFPMIAVS